MACRECHLAKVKCDNSKQIPCARCVKRSLKCVRHMSRQGHGRKERRRQRDADKAVAPLKQPRAQRVEDGVASRTWQLGPGHYGLHFTIRMWISYAVSRKSLSLMGKACALATKCGITMDELLSGDNDFTEDTGMGYLDQVITLPAAKQVVVGGRVPLTEIPADLRQALAMYDHPKGRERHNPENRWIIIRQRQGGMSRWYVSAAFERDIVSWETINETFRTNSTEVKSLWLPEWEEKLKWTQGFIHQVSLHNVQGIAPCPTRAPRAKLKLASGDIEEVECLTCLHIPDPNGGFMATEYRQPVLCEEINIPVVKTPQSSSPRGAAVVTETSSMDLWNTLDEFQWTDELEELRGLLG